MDVSDSDADAQALVPDVKASWQRFLDTFEPHRPALYRYCRALTRSPWEAEDLVQDTLTKAFVVLGTSFGALPSPRAWLLRVASNLFIDRARRARFEILVEAPDDRGTDDERRMTREAAGTLIVQLAPQERAAIVLKDVFDLPLEDIALALGTTVGAVKAALHRGRGRLRVEPEAPRSSPRAPSTDVLDAFCDAFNARDLGRLTALLLDSATVTIDGLVTEYGPDAPGDPYSGSFAGTMAPITWDERGGVRAEHLAGYVGGMPTCAVHTYRGEPLVLFAYAHEDGPRVRTIMVFETEVDRIAAVRNYFFTPEVIAEVCGELGVPFATNGYRYW